MAPFWLYPVFVKRWKTVTDGDEHSSSFASYDVGSSAFATSFRENYQYLLFDASIIKVRLSRNGVEAYFSANGYVVIDLDLSAAEWEEGEGVRRRAPAEVPFSFILHIPASQEVPGCG